MSLETTATGSINGHNINNMFKVAVVPTLQTEYDDTKAKLNAKIPRDVISQRKGFGNTTLSYLEGWYVVARLNEVLGQGNWQYTTKLDKVNEKRIKNARGLEVRAVAYSAIVTLVVNVAGKEAVFQDVGVGKGQETDNELMADESAMKEAVTDGLKRAARNLGMSMGLALYDKTEENIDDTPSPSTKETNTSHQQTEAKRAPDADVPTGTTRSPKKPVRDSVEKALRTYISVASKLGKTTTEEVIKYLKEKTGKEKIADINEEELNSMYQHFKALAS